MQILYEKIASGSLVIPGKSGTPTRVLLRNKILVADEVVGPFPRTSGTASTLQEAVQKINEACNYNLLPMPLTPVWYRPDGEPYNYPSELSEYAPISILGDAPDVSTLKFEFNGKTYPDAGTFVIQVNAYNHSNTVKNGGDRVTSFKIRSDSAENQWFGAFYMFGGGTEGSGPFFGVQYSFLLCPQSYFDSDGKIISLSPRGAHMRVRLYKSEKENNYVYFVNATYVTLPDAFLDYTPSDPTPPEPPTPGGDDPYKPGGSSGTGGGSGSFDTSSDPVDFSELPTLSAVNAGFISLFNPTNSELQALAAKMWSTDFLDAFTRFFSDPADVIISLSIVPVQPPISGKVEVQAGFIGTGVTMNKITSQYLSMSCGSVEVVPFYDAALDYSPFTKLSIFLPFIGIRSLDIDECMGKTLAVNYNMDLLSGSCVCEIKCGDAVLYSFNGNIVSEIPTSSRSFDALITASFSAVTAIGTAVATGGATTGEAVSATANAIMAAKPEIVRSGNTSSTTGLLAGKVPYLIYQIPNQSVPENSGAFTGYPANITATLGDLSGFTQVSEIHLEGVPGTDGELDELDRLLKEGVIL